ncbi:MAG: hypothetical protein NZ455_12065 [Bacteroidia bacterium]|nr:hypothetical protein [Bacteroidia bacterium]MDW8346636.1 hypothetical protein [Bacteroidia bacterium]
MRHVIITVFVTIFSCSQAQNDWALGLRLGDPTGFTTKKFMGKTAIEINVGRTYMFYSRPHEKYFYDWYKGKKYGYHEIQYLAYRRSMPMTIQLHFYLQNPISSFAGEDTEGLAWYAGGGLQFRSQTYRYDYRYKSAPNSGWIYVTGERVTDIDLGIDGTIGLEYKFEDLPISIMGDINLFLELVDTPSVWLQGSVGVRYHLSGK